MMVIYYWVQMTQKLNLPPTRSKKIDRLRLEEQVVTRTLGGESVRKIAKDMPIDYKTVNRYQHNFILGTTPETRLKLATMFRNMIGDLERLRREGFEELMKFKGTDNALYVKMYNALLTKIDKNVKILTLFIPTKTMHAEVINKHEIKEYVIRNI